MHSVAVLFAALPKGVERRLGAFIAHEVAHTACAFGAATQADAIFCVRNGNLTRYDVLRGVGEGGVYCTGARL